MRKEACCTNKYSRIVTGSFFVILVGFALAAIMKPDEKLSQSERRTYAQAPELSWAAILDGSYMSDLEKYLLDRFAGRDGFRKLKTQIETSLFGKSDANHYVRIEDSIYELDYDWNKNNVTRAAEKFAALQKELFADANVYYALIPDKSYFLPKNQYPTADDNWVLAQMQAELTDAVYIDLYPYLSIEDYYRTDLHWKQESILDVAEVLCETMKLSDEADMVREERMEDVYEIKLVTSEFYGGYAGASAYQVTPDELYAVTSEAIENAVVYDYETKQNVAVYASEKLVGMDPYDYYLWGARALLTIENPLCENGKKLLLFRDSFGSSMAPLLLEDYETITLVDLRYISADYMTKLADTSEYEDVLFLYSQRVLRHSDSMKF